MDRWDISMEDEKNRLKAKESQRMQTCLWICRRHQGELAIGNLLGSGTRESRALSRRWPVRIKNDSLVREFSGRADSVTVYREEKVPNLLDCTGSRENS